MAEKKKRPSPFISYGIGIRNFFKLQGSLIKLFILLTLISIVQMIIFSTYNGLDHLGDQVTISAKLSFGNVGFPTSTCAMNTINWSTNTDIKYLLQCQGSTQIDRVISSGIMMDSVFPFGTDDDSLRKCSMTEDEIAQSNLMPYYDTASFEKELMSQCAGKELCHAEIPRALFLHLPPEWQLYN